MTKKERFIKRTTAVECCSAEDAEKFYNLKARLESPDFTPEEGKAIYKEMEELRTEIKKGNVR